MAGGGSGSCTGQTDLIGDGCAATSAQLSLPYGAFVDGSGNIFIADTYNSVIREVPAATGVIQTIAGTQYDFATVPAPVACSQGTESQPPPRISVCPTPSLLTAPGNIFIADTGNSVIREVTGGDILTVAGNGTAGYSGNSAAATSAELNFPSGLFVDSADDIFIADTI